MYSTCLFCTSSLGRNDSIEPFPVGRRLAFDAARGRLWVVCRKCGRWNLSPIEERWEAVEECERRFRATRLRVSTEQIGLARLPEGLELVRIGAPERPEFAAWRYGDQFGKRRRRTIAIVGASVVVGGVLLATGSLAWLKATVPAGGLLYQIPNWLNLYRHHRRVVLRVPDARGHLHVVRQRHVSAAQLVRHEERWALRVAHEDGSTLLAGEEAVRAASHLLATLNHAGAFQKTIAAAVTRLESLGGPEAMFQGVAQDDPGDARRPRWTMDEGVRSRIPRASLTRLPTVDRLALEMAANEAHERRALEGELAALADEWREAEEIAAIADDLLLPDGVDAGMRRARRARLEPPTGDG